MRNSRLFTGRVRMAQGQILLLALVFAGIFMTVTVALIGTLTSYGRSGRIAVFDAQALAIAEGALDAAAYELNQNSFYGGATDVPVGNGTFTVAVASVNSQTKRITATGYVPNRQNPKATKTIKADLGITNATISFRYGIQAGNGGFTLENSSKVVGNVFASGPVIGSSANMIYGDVISAGADGLVYGVHATSSIYAHTIGKAGETTIADRDAYYVTKINTTVSGTSYPNSPDQATTTLPISDAQIAEWEAEAAAGGTAVCTGGSYTISSGSTTIGPLKIPCNLVIKNSAVVTISGHIWVTGNLTVQNSATVKMAEGLGAQNVAVIADNPSDPLNSSIITVANTATFQNSGTPGSFVFLISQNKSAESGGEVAAFNLSNSASALVAYAAHGHIPLTNTVALKEVTAYKISLQNSANVTYDTGLPSVVFQAGPGGSWTFIPGSYAITR